MTERIKKWKRRGTDIVVEAMLLQDNRDSFKAAYEWLGDSVDYLRAQDGTFINVKTGTGVVVGAYVDDYIVKTKENGFHVFHKDDFEDLYVIVKDENDRERR